MGYSVSTGKRGTEYGYFFCLGRHSGRVDCQLRYLPEDAVEQAVVDVWQSESPQLPIDELQVSLLADFEGNAERARAEVGVSSSNALTR